MLPYLPDGAGKCVCGDVGREGERREKVREYEAGLKPLCQFSDLAAVKFYKYILCIATQIK